MNKNRNLPFLKRVLESEDCLEKTLEIQHHFPCVPYYAELQKIVGERLLQKEEQSRASVVHLMESHSVGLRHAAVNAHRDKLLKRKRALNQMKNGTQPPNEIHEMPQPPNSKEMEMCMEFGKPSFPHWLENLPEEWTVVHITEFWKGSKKLNMLGFGPPSMVQSLPKLAMVRFPGSRSDAMLTSTLENPAGEVRGSLLAELSSILEGNRLVSKEFRGNREQYWKMKQEHHDQLKVLVDSLENWWLDFRKCLVIGELADSADVRTVNRVMASVTGVLKKMKKCMSESQETWMRLIINAYGYLNQAQLVRSIAKAFNVTSSKSPIVVELVACLKSVHSELDQLKTAKRNPVILVLDKVVQQLPWESMAVLSTTPTSRIPSLHFLQALSVKHGFDKAGARSSSKQIMSPTTDLKLRFGAKQVDPRLAYYIVNPGQDLPGVQQRLQPLLEEFWGPDCGLSGAVPIEQQIKQSLMERDLFLYCGHGSGSKYLPNDQLVKVDCRAAPILMGCSSGQLTANGRVVDPTGSAAAYLMAGSPGMVGMLWEVTDVDCDRFTVRLLDLLLGARQRHCKTPTKEQQRSGKKPTELPSPPDKREPEILRAVALSRPITKNFLTGAAAVVYGLPLRALSFDDPA